MRKEERKEMKMRGTELNKELLSGVTGGFVKEYIATKLCDKFLDGFKCNMDNKWGWKMNAKCSCGLHGWIYEK